MSHRARRLLANLATAVAMTLALACNRIAPAPEETTETVLELRDAQGRPTFTLERTGQVFRYQQAGGDGGRITAASAGRFRTEVAGRGAVEAWRLEGGGVEIRGAQGLQLRLTREGTSWRLGDAGGIPLARVRLDEKSGEGVGHDPGGLVIIRVQAGGGRLTVADRDGRTRAIITGKLDQLSLIKAALVALPSLGAAERALLSIAAGA